jgi:hypothetical protein
MIGAWPTFNEKSTFLHLTSTCMGAERRTFRSFLLVSLNHFFADQRDRHQAQKRGGGQPVFSLDAPEAEQR